MGEQEHYGRGNAAVTRDKVEEVIREKGGAAKTSEIAEECGVSDVAVRKRLKQKDWINSRKIRNRLVWAIPPEPKVPETDGHGGWIEHIPVEGITPTFADVGLFFGILGLLSVIANIAWGLTLAVSVAFLCLSSMAVYGAHKFKDKADPDFDFEDMQDHLEGRKG